MRYHNKVADELSELTGRTVVFCSNADCDTLPLGYVMLDKDNEPLFVGWDYDPIDELIRSAEYVSGILDKWEYNPHLQKKQF